MVLQWFYMVLQWHGMVPLALAHTAAWAPLGEPAYNKQPLTVQYKQTLIGQCIWQYRGLLGRSLPQLHGIGRISQLQDYVYMYVGVLCYCCRYC